MRRSAIVFTRNRPSSLAETLESLTPCDIPVFVLDDSTTPSTRRRTQAVVTRSPKHIHYHGSTAQERVSTRLSQSVSESRVLAPLGQKRWTLGFNRNYALILARLLDIDELLFLDDDIQVMDNAVQRAFEGLATFPIVSGNIENMPDSSIIGFYRDQAGLPDASFLSGGFMALDLSTISHPFVNIYNEDWIWGYFEQIGRQAPLVDGVSQAQYDLGEKSKTQLHWQEFGEIVELGLRRISDPLNSSSIRETCYWDRVIKNRRQLVESISSLTDTETVTSDCEQLLEYHTKVKPATFAKIFVQYPEYRREWQAVYQSVSDAGELFNTGL